MVNKKYIKIRNIKKPIIREPSVWENFERAGRILDEMGIWAGDLF